jgi:4-aminobutyrate aminotransferase-like enzyme
MAKHHPIMADVRAAGLFLGVEIVKNNGKAEADPDTTAKVVNGLREKNVLISATGLDANILKIRPPLVFSRANADFFVEKLSHVLSNLKHESI